MSVDFKAAFDDIESVLAGGADSQATAPGLLSALGILRRWNDPDVDSAIDSMLKATDSDEQRAWLARAREIAGPMYAAGYKEQA